MSLLTGLQQLQGLGGSQANSLFDTNVEALDAHARRFLDSQFIGEAQAGILFDAFYAPFNFYIEAVQFAAYFGPPTGADLKLRFQIGDTGVETDFTLPAGSTAAVATATSPIFVAAAQSLYWKFQQVGSTNPGSNVKIRIQIVPTEATE